MTGGPQGRAAVAVAWWLPAAVVLVAVNLRPAVVGVGPLLPGIQADQHLSATAAGVLTALPVLCFGALAPIGPRLARRVGIERALATALLLLCVGCAVRLLPAVWALFLGTVLIGAAVASGNVLLPALIKRDFAQRTGVMTAAYSAALTVGGALAAAFSVPLADGLGIGWRAALGFWGLLVVIALACWLPQLRRVGRPAVPGIKVRGLGRQPLAWHVTVFMGLQSLVFYTCASWLPAVFVGRGFTPTSAGVLLAVMGLTGILGGAAAPVLATRFRDQRLLAVGISAVFALGLVLVLVPGVETPAMIVMGVAQGAALGLALTLMPLRSPDAAHAAQLSGMAQSIGYVMAAAGPFVFGALHDLTGGSTVPLLVVLALLVPMGIAGFLAGRNTVLEVQPNAAAIASTQAGPPGRTTS